MTESTTASVLAASPSDTIVISAKTRPPLAPPSPSTWKPTREQAIESWRRHELAQLAKDNVRDGFLPAISRLGVLSSDEQSPSVVNDKGQKSPFYPDWMSVTMSADGHKIVWGPTDPEEIRECQRRKEAVARINARWDAALLDTERDPGLCNLRVV